MKINYLALLAVGLLMAKPAKACTQYLSQPAADVFQALMFPQDASVIGECLALLANGAANATIESAVATYLATNIKETAAEPMRSQIEAWLKRSQDTSVLDTLALGFGIECQPTSCFLRESQFASIKTALLSKSSQKKWLEFRMAVLVAKGIGFDSVLEANLAATDPYEKILIDAFKGYSVEYFNSNVSQVNASRFKYWTNLVYASINDKYAKFSASKNPGFSELLPLMQDFLVLKSITDGAVLAAKKQKISLLKNRQFQSADTDTTWKTIIEDIYPIYWKLVAALHGKTINNDLTSLTTEQFERLFVSTLISDEKLATTPAGALQALSFSRYPSTNRQRLKFHLEDWQNAIASRFCSAADPNCLKSDTDLLVLAARQDTIDARNEDLINAKSSLIARDGSGYIRAYESLVDTLDRTDPFYCETVKSPVYTPCITLGTVLKKAVDPLLYAVNDRYSKLDVTSSPPLVLLEMVNNFEFAYALAFNSKDAGTDGLFVQKFIAVAVENKKIDLAASYRLGEFTLDAAGQPGFLHQAICKRVGFETDWFPVSSDVALVRAAKIERIVQNLYSLNRLVSRVVLKQEKGPLNWDNERDRDTLNGEFFNLMSMPPLTAACEGTVIDFADFNDSYLDVFNEMNSFLYSQQTYWDRDLTDIKSRYDN